MLDTTFTSVVASDDAVLNFCIWTNIAIICHDTIHSEVEVGCRQARDTDSILQIEELWSFVILIRHCHDNSSR